MFVYIYEAVKYIYSCGQGKIEREHSTLAAGKQHTAMP